MRYNLIVSDIAKGTARERLQTLAEFRYALRRFLHFSELAASEAGLHPQQHQLLLQIAGAPSGSVASIAYAAERLGLRHHTVVELVDRSVAEGLLIRTEDPSDGRRVILAITKKGRKILQNLSEYHARELRELGPRLIRSLKDIEDLQKAHQRRPQ
jgi:DNA-binding MarR family transcriptional regulator